MSPDDGKNIMDYDINNLESSNSHKYANEQLFMGTLTENIHFYFHLDMEFTNKQCDFV